MSPSLRVEVEGVDPEIFSLTLLGVDPGIYTDLHQPELANGTFLDALDSIVLPMKVAIANRLSVGDEITLAAEGRTVTLTVAGRLKVGRDAISPYGEQSPTAFVPLSTAQDLPGAPGQVDRVEVVLRPSVDVNRAKADLAQQVGSGCVHFILSLYAA